MIVRFVPCFVSEWEKAFAGDVAYTETKLPHWALSSFSPGDKEEGQISVYEIDDEIRIADVAAAMAFLKKSSTRWFFVGTSRASIEAKGLDLIETKGATQHPSVNVRHRDIAVPDRSVLTALASLFLKGEPLNVEKKEIQARLTAHARANAIDWIGTAKSCNPNAWEVVRDFTKRSVVNVIGQAS